MIESRNLVNLPVPLKVVALLACTAILLAFLWIVFTKVGIEGYRDWIVLAMAVIQIVLTGLFLIIFVAFGRTDLTIREYRKRTTRFLAKTMRISLERITSKAGVVRAKVDVEGDVDIFGARYTIAVDGTPSVRMWVGLNVDRVIVIYFVAAKDGGVVELEEVKEAFADCMGGAEQIGYDKPHYHPVSHGNDRVFAVWATKSSSLEGLLTSPQKQLFIAQDIAMMTQSMFRSAARARREFTLITDLLPEPL